MEEMTNPRGPRKELVNNYFSEFMQSVKDIQTTLRDKIRSACEYRPNQPAVDYPSFKLMMVGDCGTGIRFFNLSLILNYAL
ncbi:mediator of RNA polymerase ii transcription subunit 11 [Phtheirospermum japonicum]|uniref:Mediator of RNA polymerase ii transcription subunit 11 n=1 Tax=Phtheirospermum japonicum TaxID=374723 RepID=A0A830CJP9_9LAMI|nr:mediator of RNA polymerase ii transcription subunit 11 [Phtheirospermum japonicum]